MTKVERFREAFPNIPVPTNREEREAARRKVEDAIEVALYEWQGSRGQGRAVRKPLSDTWHELHGAAMGLYGGELDIRMVERRPALR